MRWAPPWIACVAAALTVVIVAPSARYIVRGDAAAPSLPIRAAFYYGWFPEAWKQLGISPFTWYNPTPDGFYDSGAASIVDRHISRMEYANIGAGIASWWGQGTKTDSRIPLLLAEAGSRDFYWTLYYEPALDATQVASDLAYIGANYAANPNFLKVGGKPVLFIYTRAVKTCADVATWETVNAGRFYLDPQVFAGYRTCAVQPESWHQYAPTSATDSQRGYSFTISPGFWLRTDAAPRLARDPVRWNTNVKAMIDSNAPWQLITTFNEWGEGTAVEDATQWESCSGYGVFLDALHANGGRPIVTSCGFGAATPSPRPFTPGMAVINQAPHPRDPQSSPSPLPVRSATAGSDAATLQTVVAARPFRVLAGR